MLKSSCLIIIFSTVNLFSQSGTTTIQIDSTNITSFFEEFCKIGIKDEFEKNKDYLARIKNMDEQKIRKGLYLEFIKEITYQDNAFNYDAEFERYFMAQHAADIIIHNGITSPTDSDKIMVQLFNKEIVMTLEQKRMGLFGSYKDYYITSSVNYDEYTNLHEDELSSRIFIYMPIDEAKAFKKKKSKIAMKVKLKVNSYLNSEIINKSEFYPNSDDKLTDHTYYIIKGDIEEIMFYDIATNKIYTTYSHDID